ncbi:LPXTG cell wall anchor domain-containing protein [Levilactobacillus cerevisiae]|uniref:LPXTG cell wall anchor domain-containing protein n=1 Tax=Levilactobacillus cerevisiae TaxID=1704076 RepID=UPI000F772699|nr:Ig-like domain-containing protein [Levilactobacillus cerevisiae]
MRKESKVVLLVTSSLAAIFLFESPIKAQAKVVTATGVDARDAKIVSDPGGKVMSHTVVLPKTGVYDVKYSWAIPKTEKMVSGDTMEFYIPSNVNVTRTRSFKLIGNDNVVLAGMTTVTKDSHVGYSTFNSYFSNPKYSRKGFITFEVNGAGKEEVTTPPVVDPGPGNEGPGIEGPGTETPGIENPGTENPGTENPGTENPGTENPGTENPGTENPGTENPGTENPGTENPGTENPGTENPGTENPGTETPGTENPGTEKPGTENPGTEKPGTENPGTETPSTEKPGIEKPGTQQPGIDFPGDGSGTTEKPGTESPAVTPQEPEHPGTSVSGEDVYNQSSENKPSVDHPATTTSNNGGQSATIAPTGGSQSGTSGTNGSTAGTQAAGTTSASQSATANPVATGSAANKPGTLPQTNDHQSNGVVLAGTVLLLTSLLGGFLGLRDRKQ